MDEGCRVYFHSRGTISLFPAEKASYMLNTVSMGNSLQTSCLASPLTGFSTRTECHLGQFCSMESVSLLTYKKYLLTHKMYFPCVPSEIVKCTGFGDHQMETNIPSQHSCQSPTLSEPHLFNQSDGDTRTTFV